MNRITVTTTKRWNLFRQILFLLLFTVILSLICKVGGIRHGTEVDPPKKYPFIVHGGWCAAVLLSPNVAIGSANCCYQKLLIGVHNVSEVKDGVEFQVTETLFHPDYKQETNENDIILLRLNGFSYARPIAMKEKYDWLKELDDGADLLIMGWGRTDYGNERSEVLNEAITGYMLKATCKQKYDGIGGGGIWYGGGRRDLFCASRTENDKITGPCDGDIGGPLIDPNDGSLVGLVTQQFVRSCGNKNYPTVYTNLNYHYDWIVENIAKWSCPWFGNVDYPTLTPSLSYLPSSDPTSNPTKIPSQSPTESPTKIPSQSPTEIPTKILSQSPTTNKSKKKNSKVTKKKRLNLDGNKRNLLYNFPDSPNGCHWKKEVVQETVQSVVEEEGTSERVVMVETVARRVVYTQSCPTNLSETKISSTNSKLQFFFPSWFQNLKSNDIVLPPENEPLLASKETVISKYKSLSSLCDSQNEKQVQVQIFTDRHPNELSWQIFSEASSVVFMSGGKYTQNLKLYTTTQCMNHSSYFFKIEDSFGDGILNPGYYKILVDGDQVLSGGKFDFEESKQFEFFSQPSQYPSSALTQSPTQRVYPEFCNRYEPISNYNLRAATNLYHDSKDEAVKRYGEIESWNTSLITDMDYLFKDMSGFNSNIATWDVSGVRSMKEMFMKARKFNVNIAQWNVSKAQNFDRMFFGAYSFCHNLCSFIDSCGALIEHDDDSLKDAVDQYVSHPDPITRSIFLNGGCINAWNTKKVTNMDSLFSNKNTFNENIAGWNVSRVTSMQWMFEYASMFNQDVSGWDISRVVYMTEMFHSAKVFNQNLCSWLNNTHFPNKVNTFWMFHYSGCDTTSFPISSRVCHYC